MVFIHKILLMDVARCYRGVLSRHSADLEMIINQGTADYVNPVAYLVDEAIFRKSVSLSERRR